LVVAAVILQNIKKLFVVKENLFVLFCFSNFFWLVKVSVLSWEEKNNSFSGSNHLFFAKNLPNSSSDDRIN
jgi:hypothetical protein